MTKIPADFVDYNLLVLDVLGGGAVVNALAINSVAEVYFARCEEFYWCGTSGFDEPSRTKETDLLRNTFLLIKEFTAEKQYGHDEDKNPASRKTSFQRRYANPIQSLEKPAMCVSRTEL